jgi:ABC-type branched-subunit amino acid transport system substrate-binding protein
MLNAKEAKKMRILFILSLTLVSIAHANDLLANAHNRVLMTEKIGEQDFLRAKNLFHIGEVTAAMAVLEALINAHPKSEAGLQAMLLLAEIDLSQKQPEKALQIIEKYLLSQADEARLKSAKELKTRIEAILGSPKEQPKAADTNSSKGITPQVVSATATMAEKYPVSTSALGLILPLSGSTAVYGERALIAVQMALGMPVIKFTGQPFMVQSNGTLSLIITDSKADVHVAENLVNDLVIKHQVVAILGDFLVDSSLSIAKKSEKLSVVNMSLSRLEGLTNIGSWVFRLGLTVAKQTHALVENMRQVRSMKKFAILYPTHPYGIEMKDSFTKEVKLQGGQVTMSVGYQPGETTFIKHIDQLGYRPFAKSPEYQACMLQAKNFKESLRFKNGEKCRNLVVPQVNFDALFIPDFPKTVSYILPTLVAQDFLISQNDSIVKSYQKRAKDAHPIQLLGPSSWNGDLLAQRLGEQLDGALFVDGVNWASTNPNMSLFLAQFKQLADGNPSLIEVQAYDAASILRFLLEISESKNLIKTRLDLRKSLLQVKNFNGLTGSISFDASGDSVVPLSWFSYSKGQLVPLQIYK